MQAVRTGAAASARSATQQAAPAPRRLSQGVELLMQTHMIQSDITKLFQQMQGREGCRGRWLLHTVGAALPQKQLRRHRQYRTHSDEFYMR